MILVLSPEDGRALSVLSVSEKDGEEGLLTFTKTVDTHSSWLSVVHEALQSFGVELKDITAVVVVSGATSFTGSRVAYTISNTLAYALSVPIAEISKEQCTESEIRQTVKGASLHTYVLPQYTSEPNIGRVSL